MSDRRPVKPPSMGAPKVGAFRAEEWKQAGGDIGKYRKIYRGDEVKARRCILVCAVPAPEASWAIDGVLHCPVEAVEVTKGDTILYLDNTDGWGWEAVTGIPRDLCAPQRQRRHFQGGEIPQEAVLAVLFRYLEPNISNAEWAGDVREGDSLLQRLRTAERERERLKTAAAHAVHVLDIVARRGCAAPEKTWEGWQNGNGTEVDIEGAIRKLRRALEGE
jgi:hypothetical protein